MPMENVVSFQKMVENRESLELRYPYRGDDTERACNWK